MARRRIISYLSRGSTLTAACRPVYQARTNAPPRRCPAPGPLFAPAAPSTPARASSAPAPPPPRAGGPAATRASSQIAPRAAAIVRSPPENSRNQYLPCLRLSSGRLPAVAGGVLRNGKVRYSPPVLLCEVPMLEPRRRSGRKSRIGFGVHRDEAQAPGARLLLQRPAPKATTWLGPSRSACKKEARGGAPPLHWARRQG